MGDLTTQDRLQPSLLDRLTDDDPTSKQESRQERVLSVRQYRQAVLRDLVSDEHQCQSDSGRRPR